jgi:hypothetical protein
MPVARAHDSLPLLGSTGPDLSGPLDLTVSGQRVSEPAHADASLFAPPVLTRRVPAHARPSAPLGSLTRSSAGVSWRAQSARAQRRPRPAAPSVLEKGGEEPGAHRREPSRSAIRFNNGCVGSKASHVSTSSPPTRRSGRNHLTPSSWTSAHCGGRSPRCQVWLRATYRPYRRAGPARLNAVSAMAAPSPVMTMPAALPSKPHSPPDSHGLASRLVTQ